MCLPNELISIINEYLNYLKQKDHEEYLAHEHLREYRREKFDFFARSEMMDWY